MNLDEQLNKYLADAHSIEEQALVQMRLAPRIAGTSHIAQIFRAHLAETEQHERLTRERLELGSYELLMRVAERAGDQATAQMARDIRAQEDAMASRVAGCFDEAV